VTPVAIGHLLAVPGPFTRRAGPRRPARHRQPRPGPPATAPGPRPADARDVILRALQRPQDHIAVAPACPPPAPGRGEPGTGPPRSLRKSRTHLT